MSNLQSKKMLRPFIERAPAPMFLSGFFQSPPENFHQSETVEIDIQRDGEDVAVAIKDLASGRRYNEDTKGSNKAFKPPIFKEAIALDGFQLMDREYGEHPFQNLAFQARATIKVGRGSTKCQNKIRRAVELMASQVLISGVAQSVNSDGNAVFEIDYQPKATHVATVTTTWAADGLTGNPLGDLEALADVIRTDGRHDADVIVFGATAWQRFLANPKVEKAISRDGIGLGQLAPQKRGKGATFQGFVWIGSYRFEMWTYTGTYVHPQTGTPTKYVPAEKLIMLSQEARLDLSFGAIPKIASEEGRVLPFLPSRVSDSEGLIDFTPSAWLSPDNETLHVQTSSRPLPIPTEIDSFASLDITT